MSASQQQQPNQVDLKQKISENMEFLKKNTLRLKADAIVSFEFTPVLLLLICQFHLQVL